MSLLQKIRRTNFITSIWKHALVNDIDVGDPLNNGWQLKDNRYMINWYDGQQVPENVCSHINQDFDEQPSDDIEYN